ncbi:MAG TPA: Asd/ArgC dimerization domain-containing protein [Terriglobia bacterium]|nr:Asd/ArgC dimerization domain-containing protein [Terriglobia bacterium]
MTEGASVYRVGLNGGLTLLGKEILTVLKARNFPVNYVIGVEDRSEELDAPILNIADDPIPVIEESGGEGAECDFLFLAGPTASAPKQPRAPVESGRENETAKRQFVIDVTGGSSAPSPVLRLPLFDAARQDVAAGVKQGNGLFVCPHAATIVLAGLVLRIAARLDIRNISALVFLPASELGPGAIEELQKQTIGLLNFGEVPRKVFGAQVAFNMLPRLGAKGKSILAATENRIRSELQQLLAVCSAVPAVRVVQAPSFYSMAVSIYAQSPQRATAIQIEEALSGENVRWARSSQPSASPADVQGSATLLLDPAVVELGQAGGFWLWGRADDLRLQAENAVMMAEELVPFVRHP